MCRVNDTYDQVVPSISMPDIFEKFSTAIQDELGIRNLLNSGIFSKEDHLLHSPVKSSPEVSVIIKNSCKRKNVKFADECYQPLVTIFQYEHPLYREYTSHLIPHWKTTFAQPLSDYKIFNQMLLENVILLENALVLEDPHQLYGTIAALHVGEELQVYIRYTIDGWKSFHDMKAPLLSASSVFDIYYFVINIPKPSVEINCIEFCIYCETDDKKAFIDNNKGSNYVIMLEMKPQDLPTFKKVIRKRKKKKHHNRYVVESLDYVNEIWQNYDKE